MNYFLYSKKQDKNVSGRLRSYGEIAKKCEVFVRGKWETYTEGNETGLSNFDDAVIVCKMKKANGKRIRINGIIQGVE